MGCDIHATIEVKNRDHPECGFSFAAKIELDRDYKMFSLMSGVRNYKELPQVSPLRGIPNDASCRTKEEYNLLESDAHSSSFLYFYEYKNAVALMEENINGKDNRHFLNVHQKWNVQYVVR